MKKTDENIFPDTIVSADDFVSDADIMDEILNAFLAELDNFSAMDIALEILMDQVMDRECALPDDATEQEFDKWCRENYDSVQDKALHKLTTETSLIWIIDRVIKYVSKTMDYCTKDAAAPDGFLTPAVLNDLAVFANEKITELLEDFYVAARPDLPREHALIELYQIMSQIYKSEQTLIGLAQRHEIRHSTTSFSCASCRRDFLGLCVFKHEYIDGFAEPSDNCPVEKKMGALNNEYLASGKMLDGDDGLTAADEAAYDEYVRAVEIILKPFRTNEMNYGVN